jgi:hypothetical protein
LYKKNTAEMAEQTPAQLRGIIRNLEKKSKVGWAMYYNLGEERRDVWAHHQLMSRQLKEATDDDGVLFAHLKKSFLEMMDTLKAFSECPVCIEPLDKTNTQVGNCGHLVCKSCYSNELLDKCPVCRRKYYGKKVAEEAV